MIRSGDSIFAARHLVTAVARVTVPIMILPGNEDLPVPKYSTEHAAAMDLYAAVRSPVEIPPGGTVLIPCGFALAIPEGFEGQIRPRSGLALHHGITLVNTPGTIDSDYRGEVKVPLINLGKSSFRIERKNRIAQMLVVPIPRVRWKVVKDLPESPRGKGGFGHTHL